MVIFQATCTTKWDQQMNFASTKDASLNPVGWTQLNAYTVSGADFTKRATAWVEGRLISVKTYASYTTAQTVALEGNVLVNGCWIIN